MRIALVSDCYPPRVGGIESQVHDLACRLADAGHEVHVLTATAGEPDTGPPPDSGVTVHRFAAPIPFGLPVNPASRPAVRALLGRLRPDVVHAHVGVISPFAVDGADIAQDLDLPLAVTWHCVLGVWAPLVARLGHAQRWQDAGAAQHGVSSMAADQVRALVGGRGVVRVVPNGIDPTVWRPADSAPFAGEAVPPGPAARRLRVVLAMRFTPRKRPLGVIALVRRARDQLAGEAEVSLQICGGGPLLPLVRRVVRARGDQAWVDLPGRVARADLAAHYRVGDVYLAPSRFESFGIAALEARTAGLPVVALAGSGVQDFVTDGQGGLLAAGDEGLTSALVRLGREPGLLARLRDHQQRVPPEQSWPQVLEAVLAEYRRASGSHRPRPPSPAGGWRQD